MPLRGTKKETVETISSRIDLPRVLELLKEMSDMGDYERRLLQAGLNRLNQNNAKYLPAYSLQLIEEIFR